MELLQLKYFCDAAKSENFSKTARKFLVPPSNISQSIKRLEKELSVNLFVRQSNRIFLSEQGLKFYKKISSALSLIDEAAAIVSDDGNKGKINICINTNRRFIMKVLEKFKKQYPEVNIVTKFLSDPTSDDFDLIIANDDNRLRSHKKEKIFSEKLAVAINCNNPLANGKNLNISQLSAEPFITMNEQSNLFELTQKICTDFGFEPKIAIQSDDPFYVRKCVEHELGLAIVPLFSWQGQFADNIVLRTIEGYTRDSFIYTDERKFMPICVKNFIDLLLQESKDV